MMSTAPLPLRPLPGPAVRVRGTLGSSPFAGRLYKAELNAIPLIRPCEYEGVHAFERPIGGSVLLSPTQRCRLLQQLVAEVRNSVSGTSCFLVRMYGPENIQLPKELLADDVLVTHNPFDLVHCLLAAGKQNVAVIHQGLRTDCPDAGDNEIEVWIFAPSDASGAMQSLLDHSDVLRHLDGVQAERFDRDPDHPAADAARSAAS